MHANPHSPVLSSVYRLTARSACARETSTREMLARWIKPIFADAAIPVDAGLPRCTSIGRGSIAAGLAPG